MDGIRAGLALIGIMGAGGALAACSDDDDGPSPYVSGTRLRATVLDAGDGAVMFEHWRDTALGLDCDFVLAADGLMRCLPVDFAFIAYADAACSQPVAIRFADPTCAGPTFATGYVESDDTCAPPRRTVYQIGESLGTAPIFFPSGAACEQFFTREQFAITPADLTMFVGEATRTTEPRGGGLAATVVVADDGTQQIVDLVDTSRGHCEPYTLNDGTMACLANVASERGTFDDEACAQPVAAASACSDAGAVQTADGVHLAGARSARPVFVDGGDTCAIDDELAAYTPGPIATAGSGFPALGATIRGDGHAAISTVTDHAGRPLVARYFVDPQRGRPCHAVRDAAHPDTLRCMPDVEVATGGNAWEFADDRCTVEVVSLSQELSWPGLIAHGGTTSTCGDDSVVESVFSLVAHAGPIFESHTTGTCIEAVRDPARFYYADDVEIPLDSLPLLTRRTE